MNDKVLHSIECDCQECLNKWVEVEKGISSPKCLCIHALDGYETYKIDDNTIGVRPIWFHFLKDDARFENHCSYLVSDGTFVTTAWFDGDEFVGCESDLIGEIKFWMPFPNRPEKQDSSNA